MLLLLLLLWLRLTNISGSKYRLRQANCTSIALVAMNMIGLFLLSLFLELLLLLLLHYLLRLMTIRMETLRSTHIASHILVIVLRSLIGRLIMLSLLNLAA